MIFILKEREVLTGQRLNELEINGVYAYFTLCAPDKTDEFSKRI